jgi:hypothetical protein
MAVCRAKASKIMALHVQCIRMHREILSARGIGLFRSNDLTVQSRCEMVVLMVCTPVLRTR